MNNLLGITKKVQEEEALTLKTEVEWWNRKTLKMGQI